MLLQTSSFLPKSVLGLALGLLVTGLVGCGSSEPTEDAAVDSHVTNTLVNAQSIADLAPGALLTVDLQDNVVYHFDYSEAPIDYTRIKLIDENGTETAMASSMQKVADFNYGMDTAVDLLATHDQRFNMGWDPSDMQKLSDSDRVTLEETGYLYKVLSSPATSQPQNEDHCIYATCEVCPDGWGNGPCYLIHHVWCD